MRGVAQTVSVKHGSIILQCRSVLVRLVIERAYEDAIDGKIALRIGCNAGAICVGENEEYPDRDTCGNNEC
jgi:hypothetical protein